MYVELFNVNYNLYLNCGSVVIVGSDEGHSEQLRNIYIYIYIYIYYVIHIYIIIFSVFLLLNP